MVGRYYSIITRMIYDRRLGVAWPKLRHQDRCYNVEAKANLFMFTSFVNMIYVKSRARHDSKVGQPNQRQPHVSACLVPLPGIIYSIVGGNLVYNDYCRKIDGLLWWNGKRGFVNRLVLWQQIQDGFEGRGRDGKRSRLAANLPQVVERGQISRVKGQRDPSRYQYRQQLTGCELIADRMVIFRRTYIDESYFTTWRHQFCSHPGFYSYQKQQSVVRITPAACLFVFTFPFTTIVFYPFKSDKQEPFV